jgi:hypothetical protein
MREVSGLWMHGRLFENADSIRKAIAIEHHLHAGVFQCLKWTMEFADPNGAPGDLSPEELTALVDLGRSYEALVDCLKMGKHNRVVIQLDRSNKTITVFEGGDLTGFDLQLKEHQANTLPYYAYSSFVDDEDQLTGRWRAGQYRTLVERLGRMAEISETAQAVSTFPGLEAAMSLPDLIEIPECPDQELVLEDLTLTPEKMNGRGKWKLTTWLDIPLVLIGGVRVGVTNMLKTTARGGRDDHMLRTAVRIDPMQYSKVSPLREDRMIKHCRGALEIAGWRVTPHHRLTDPPAELDIFATRAGERLILQLKSTLRPETPWEVQKRNDDILYGIEHTAAAVRRIDGQVTGFVITDGYRGDHVTWARSFSDDIMVGTVRDLADVADNPMIARELLRQRAGFNPQGRPAPLPDREFKLFDWTFRLVDQQAPERIVSFSE